MDSPSFKAYVEKNLLSQIERRICRFVKENPEMLYGKVTRLGRVRWHEYDCSEIVRLWADDAPGSALVFDTLVKSDFVVHGRTGHNDDDEEPVQEWFLVKCIADLAKPGCGLEIMGIDVYKDRDNNKAPLSDTLTRRYEKSELESIAQKTLECYQPEVLKKPLPVDVEEMARSLGLSIVTDYHLSSDLSVYGMTIFRARDVIVYSKSDFSPVTLSVQPGTILVDGDVSMWNGFGSFRFTVAHEISHYILHKKRIMLEVLCGNDVAGLQCQKDGFVSNVRGSDLISLEWQANYLASCLLTPRKMFLEKMETTFISLQAKYNRSQWLVDYIESIIDGLADFFEISRQATKLRLVDCGIHEAIEAYNYVDGHYVAPVGFKKGTLESNETFAISLQDLLFQMVMNPELKRAFDENKLYYLHSHVCLNKPEYIELGENGRPQISEYARMNAHESMIKFRVELNDKNISRHYSWCSLFREFNGISRTTTFDKDILKDFDARIEAMNDWIQEDSRISALIVDDRVQTLKNLMAENGYTYLSLGEEIHVSEQTISNYLNSRSEPGKGMVYALCIAFKLTFSQSLKFLKVFGFSFSNSQFDQAMKFLIECDNTYSIDYCNKVLEKMDQPSIGGKTR